MSPLEASFTAINKVYAGGNMTETRTIEETVENLSKLQREAIASSRKVLDSFRDYLEMEMEYFEKFHGEVEKIKTRLNTYLAEEQKKLDEWSDSEAEKAERVRTA